MLGEACAGMTPSPGACLTWTRPVSVLCPSHNQTPAVRRTPPDITCCVTEIFYHSQPHSVLNQPTVNHPFICCSLYLFWRLFPIVLFPQTWHCCACYVYLCRALPGMMQWIRSQRPGESGINIITADFVELGEFISAVITLNYHYLDDDDDATWKPAGGVGERSHRH